MCTCVYIITRHFLIGEIDIAEYIPQVPDTIMDNQEGLFKTVSDYVTVALY